MIDSQWRNVCTVVVSVLLMLVAMVQIVIALALNLRSESWVDRASVLSPEKTRLTTGVNILIDSLFIFPAAWTGICAAVSRHRGVYIALAVIASLAFIGVIGGLVDIAWEFGNLGLFRDTQSSNDELAIALLVMQALLLLTTIGLLIFTIIGLLYDCPKHSKHGSREHLMTNPPQYNSAPALTYPSVPQRAASLADYRPANTLTDYRQANTLADYRPLTKGSPDWDRFYEQYFANGKSQGGDDYRRQSRNRSSSYRF